MLETALNAVHSKKKNMLAKQKTCMTIFMEMMQKKKPMKKQVKEAYEEEYTEYEMQMMFEGGEK